MTKLLLSFLLLPVAADRLQNIADAEKRMEELLAGEASIWTYLFGLTIFVVAFVMFCGGLITFLCCAFKILSYFGCCLGCFGRCGRRASAFVWQKFTYAGASSSSSESSGVGGDPDKTGCVSPYMPVDGDLEKAGARCQKVVSTVTNASGVKVQVPYCEKHLNPLRRRVFEKGAPFEASGTRYRINFHYEMGLANDVASLLRQEIAQAKKIRVRASGFVYIFQNRDDVDRVSYDEKRPYMFKIGMTRLKAAKMRVDQWPDSVFGNVKNVDYFPTKDAVSSEAIVHALLARQRVARYNDLTHDFEIEWFFVTKEDAMETVRKVTEAVDKRRFEQLLNEAN